MYTTEGVRNNVYYCKTSPSGLRWKSDREGGKDGQLISVFKDDPVGSLTVHNKWHICTRTGHFYAHRVVWEIHYGPIPKDKIIDHIDGNSSNNMITNLRLVDQSLNSRNRKMQKDNTSGKTGVYLRHRPEGCYWVSTWMEESKGKSKSFGINKYGKDYAYKLACDFRDEMIEKLNGKGYGYTDRHGVSKEVV